MLANMASKFLNIILVPIYTVYLQPDDFGESNLLLLLSGVIGIVFSLDVIDASYRFLMEDEKNERNVITNSFLIYFMGAAIFSAIYFPLVIKFGLKYGWILGVHILITTFQQLQQQMARGLRLNRIYASSGVLMCLLQGMVNILLIVCLKAGSVSVLLAPIIASLITIIYIDVGMGIYNKIDLKEIDLNTIKKLGRYGIPIALSILCTWITLNSGLYVITLFAKTAAMAGIYVLANKFPSIINAFVSVFILAWQEIAIEESNKEGYEIYCNKIYNKYYDCNMYAFILVLPLISLYFSLFNPGEYAAAKKIIPICLFVGMMENMRGYILTNYYVEMDTREILQNAFYTCVLTVTMGFPFMQWFGLFGLAASIAVGQMFHFFITKKRIRKYISYSLRKKESIALTLILFVVIGIFFNGLPGMQMAVLLIVGVFILFKERSLLRILLHATNNSDC